MQLDLGVEKNDAEFILTGVYPASKNDISEPPALVPVMVLI
jgi:hypothetical protein